MQLTPLCTAEAAVNPKQGSGTIIPIRCKRWSCEVCAERNRRKVIAFGKAGNPTAFLTLTVTSTAYSSPDEAARDLKRAWCALRRRMQRAHPGHKIPFLAVFERHKSGFPHMHLLIRAPFIPIKKLRAWWEEITTHSWNVNIMALGTRGLVAYAAKYIGKDLESFERCKRWWRSHDYNEKQALTEAEIAARKEWGRYEASPEFLLKALEAMGAIIERTEADRYTWRSPPDRTVTIHDALHFNTNISHGPAFDPTFWHSARYFL